jgi:hypothetical protein
MSDLGFRGRGISPCPSGFSSRHVNTEIPGSGTRPALPHQRVDRIEQLLSRSSLSILAFFVLAAAGCAAASPVAVVDGSPDARTAIEEVEIPIALYVVTDSDEGADSPLSSTRTVDDVAAIADRVGTIWDGGGVVLDVQGVHEIDVPAEVLLALAQGDTDAFLSAAVEGRFAVPDPSVINGFYVRDAGGVNGVAPAGTRTFFVVDEPTVHDERVTSHEIGHIFGLHHAIEDPDRLMYSGTNGTDITELEAAAAVYGARRVLDGLR